MTKKVALVVLWPVVFFGGTLLLLGQISGPLWAYWFNRNQGTNMSSVGAVINTAWWYAPPLVALIGLVLGGLGYLPGTRLRTRTPVR